MDAATRMSALCCRFGAYGALEFSEFESTLKELPEKRREFLSACWSALADIAPTEAGLERRILTKAICELRDEWKKQ